MQPAQSLLAAVQVPWPRGPRALHPLGDEANHAPVGALGEVAQKRGTDAAAAEPLVRGCLCLEVTCFPGPDRELDEHGFAVVHAGVR